MAGGSSHSGVDEGTPIAPLRQFVLKVHSRCDLACDYCYVYAMGDERWRSRSPVMSQHTVDLAAARIAEHVRDYRAQSIDVILHGGEPLLAGPDLLAYAVRAVRGAVPRGVSVQALIQTNGVRLNASFLDLFDELDVLVGVSVDGDPAAHDRHRHDRHKRGSSPAVTRALHLLTSPRYRRLFGGLLCTVDLDNDPVEVYEALLGFNPPVIDLLLPHGSWSSPPPGRDPESTDSPYGEWLSAVFDRWYDAPQRETRIRLFDDVIRLLLGGQSRTETVGFGPATTVVVQTDGEIEESDFAYATSHLPNPELSIATHPMDAVLQLPYARSRRGGIAALSAVCRSCRVVRVCGGGLYAHRYRRGSGYLNPSVYCRDLSHLVDHVRERLSHDVRALTDRPA